jgi:hypothetical protein
VSQGMEAYVGGRVVQTWQLPKPFLEACYLEVCKQSTGTCKATGYKFKKVGLERGASYLAGARSGSLRPCVQTHRLSISCSVKKAPIPNRFESLTIVRKSGGVTLLKHE